MPESPPTIFISYAREDSGAAQRLYNDLKRAGANPWLDKESLLPGHRWKVEIRRAIRESRYFLAVLSSNSVSRRGYVHKEVAEALEILDEFPESEIFMIPVRLDDCSPSHEKLSDLHWVDMFPSWDNGVEKILRAIGVHPEGDGISWKWAGIIAAAVAVLVALGAWLGPNAVDVLSNWLSSTPAGPAKAPKIIAIVTPEPTIDTPTVIPTSSPTHTPVIPTTTPTGMPLPPTTAPTAPPVAGIDCMGAAAGDKVTLLYQWSGAEAGMFDAVVKPLVDACGIVIEPEFSRDQVLMDARVKAGTPWDVVIWPTTVALTQYSDQLAALGEAGADPANYADYWKAIGSVEGKWLAMPVKVNIKTIIWYSPAGFEANGYKVPTTWDELDALVETMVADGNVPWSMGMESGEADGWAASDFIQDILLVQQGPQYVLDIISGKVPYNDAGVKKAYETYGKWAKGEKYTVGGAKGTVSISFKDAIYKPFSDPPEAMMVRQADFAAGEIWAKYPDLEYGVDYDFFPVPGAKGMQGSADFLMVFNASPAAKALVAYLSSEAGALEWAWVGFDLSPNNKVVDADYLDARLSKEAKALAGAAGFTPDIGDIISGEFNTAEWKAIIDYVNGADLDTVLARAARAQARATQ